jgi:hypothetical protein
MTGITRNSQRATLVHTIEAMRPTIDAVHDAMLRATEFGVTYSAVAGATGTNETRAQRWSAGADIPERVGERRAILSTLARLLSDMPSPPDRRRKLAPDQERWRRAEERIKAESEVLCMQCQRRRAINDNELCGRRSCRAKAEKENE